MFNPTMIGSPSPPNASGSQIAVPGDIRFFLSNPGAGWALCNGAFSYRGTPAALIKSQFDLSGVETNTSIPDMTSSSTPTGYSSGWSQAYNNDNAWGGWTSFDSTIGDGWSTGSNGAHWISQTLPSPIWIGAVAITAVSTSYPDVPQNFYIEGSNDGGSTYTRLLTVTGLPVWAASQRKVFPIAGVTQAYRTFKFNAYMGSGGTYVRVGRVEWLKDLTGFQLPTIAALPNGAQAYMRTAG